MPEGQSAFVRSLLDPSQPLPDGVMKRQGGAALKRFDVYRNNVIVGLVEALLTGFPVTARLLGEAFFRQAARDYARLHPPASPLMIYYGQTFPDYLAGLSEMQKLTYAVDVARIEWARREATHAADAEALRPDVMQKLPQDGLENIIFHFHPACRLVSSRFASGSVWQAEAEGKPFSTDMQQGETIVVTRPELQVQLVTVDAVSGTFLQCLHRRYTISDAMKALERSFAEERLQSFDFASMLVLLFTSGALQGWTIFNEGK